MMYLRAVQGMVVVAFAAVCFPPAIQCQQELPRTTEPAGVAGKEKPRKELNSALRDAATWGHTEYVKLAPLLVPVPTDSLEHRRAVVKGVGHYVYFGLRGGDYLAAEEG